MHTDDDVPVHGRVCQKFEMVTRRKDKAKRDAADAAAWRRCKEQVDRRDGILCRICGCRTKKCRDRVPTRGEHCHIKGRLIEPGLIHDPRNVFLGCGECHDAFDLHGIYASQPEADQFEYEGRRFLDADKDSLVFTRVGTS